MQGVQYNQFGFLQEDDLIIHEPERKRCQQLRVHQV